MSSAARSDVEASIREACATLASAIVAALLDSEPDDGPDRLLSVAEAAQRLGIGRSALYGALGRGEVRSVKVGRRRLIPSGAIADVADGR